MADDQQYFRIDDTAYLVATPYDPDKPAIADYFPQLHQIAVLKEFENVDMQLLEFLDRVKDAATRKLLGLFNDKLNLMSRYLHIHDIHEHQLDAQSINIGEAGVRGVLPDHVQTGQELALAIIFPPSYLSLFCRARVSQAQTTTDGGTDVELSFVELPESQRQALTRHMFKVQAQNRDSS
ncbi:PilZ domain-containing protein [Saccharospirillum sp. MSK14-1]|uniref:PilZ domain-containing protein n=1 Tax=Saccharospirillum sp. MSK14-1 TaxID=1897632 RepID=UPI001304CDE6|nr:PilZ domain-containing protein [Saccharospirillum sp. MSK14-1]